MPFYLFWPEPQDLIASGFEIVADVPCIFDGSWKYQEEVSDYLDERATGKCLLLSGKKPRGSLSPQSLQSFGESLCNFLEYCELRKLDWRKIDYDVHILRGYQKEMQNGTFSTRRKGLAAATVNARVDEACNFLNWTYHRGLREEFIVPMIKRLISAPLLTSHGHKKKEVEARVGAVRPKPVLLRMPQKEEISAWLESVRIEKGDVKKLICELIIETGIRREEAVQWRIDTLPLEKEDWVRTGNLVTISIKYGAKGKKYENDKGELEGPERAIDISIEMAEKIHAYRSFVRPKIFADYVRKASTKQEKEHRKRNKSNRLFLSEFTGQPVSPQSLYEAWTEVSRQPYKGWSPHIGRHYWACNKLLEELKARAKTFQKLARHEFPADWIHGTAKDIILLIIQPQLGHVSPEITQAYLTWVGKSFVATDLDENYERALEEK